MTTRLVRKNEAALKWIRAGAFGVGTAWALTSLSFTPGAGAYGLGIATGVLALFSPGLAVLLSIVCISLPVIASDFVVGVVMLVVGLAAIQYLGQENGRVYLLILFAFIGASYGPVWAVAVVAGYLMGASEGAAVAVVAALAVELAGLVAGREMYGMVASGGVAPGLVDTSSLPENLLTFGWVADSLADIDPGNTMDVFTSTTSWLLLLVQPVVWGAAAVVAGLVKRPLADKRRKYFALLAVTAGVLTAAVGSTVALTVSGRGVDPSSIGIAAGASLVVTLAIAASWEWVFPPVSMRSATSMHRSIEEEDADVDELLRLIASAEDKLAGDHTTQAVVMITDMKAFSQMTEEDGSVISAKQIQRHRDLLLPVINSYDGKGKSTGGDGLMAAFESADDAMRAAVTMQRSLKEHNANHAGERDMVIRIGIADGEIVLDKGGRPFIGNALNLAARVMNLGDGGQIFTTKPVADAAKTPDIVRHRHGAVELKNIAKPVEAIEILWAQGQKPTKPRILD